MKVEGLAALDAALGELPKATARRVLHKVLRKAAEPMRAAAQAAAPVDTGELKASIATSTRIANKVGAAEYAGVMGAGGSKAEALAALRAARRAATEDGTLSFAQVFVGPTKAKTKQAAIKRIVQEFGSVKQAPQPYMRPAFDGQKSASLGIIRTELGGEIDRAAKRLAAKRAAKGK